MTTIEIGGLTFYGSPHPSGLQFRRLIDWDSLPDSKSDLEPRPQDHGSFDPGEDYRAASVISIEGWYQGADRRDALDMRQRITGALAGQDLRITVEDELGPTHRDVSVRRAPLKDIIGARFEFAIDMVAADPKRYGDEIRAFTGLPVLGGGITYPITYPIDYGFAADEGRVLADNTGTASTYSRIEVTGGLDGGFSAVEVGTGREIRFERQIPLGSTVVVNQRTGRAYIDDPANDVSGFLTRSDWWEVPDGGTTVIQFNAIGAPSGTPILAAITAPAFW